MMRRRKRVLVSAFAFSPYHGSECGVGWNIATRLARMHDVTVLTGSVSPFSSNESELRSWLREHSYIEGLHVVNVSPGKQTLIWERLHHMPGCWPLYYRAYNLWQRDAFLHAVQLHRNEPFDICHQLTIVSYREPGYLWQMGVPFFWGPISGTDLVPWGFVKMASGEEWARVLVRELLNRIQKNLAIRSAQAAKKARLVFGVSRSDLCQIQGKWRAKALQLCETGTDEAISGISKVKEMDSPLRIVWSGLHISRKALPLLLSALDRMPSNLKWELDILGDGPQRTSWKRFSDLLRYPAENLRWHGNLSHSDALQIMDASHVLVHTGIKESTTTVIMEALSLGLPVICHDASGMGEAVTDECGIKIPFSNPETSVEFLAKALRLLLVEPGLLTRLSSGALARARELSWDGIVKRISDAYEEYT